MINEKLILSLKKEKNLLAFSYGSDSCALFFILLKHEINFDLALINYGVRASSDEEEDCARKLALKFNKKFYSTKAPIFTSNFEKNARDFRYKFFDELCKKHKYDNLLLAHNLNDRLEWFLMQFSRGAGVLELYDFKDCKQMQGYKILRPLLFTSKREILGFLKENELKFFHDESNDDERYFRNYIRKKYSNSFVQEFESGVKKSFSYIEKDLEFFKADEKEFCGIYICDIRENFIAKCAKKLGFVLSTKQRKEALKGDCVISKDLGLCYFKNKALLFKYEKSEKMPKTAREEFRKAKIPPLLRAYLYNKQIKIDEFLALFTL
ncbi:tRNA(Ile)-lysidine synthetase [Campylobacter avium LMG 24591]|uniref:tRNA(Ile)-lysidine synthase n=1 Tax=Campylobacter avium LMG 24591 TaxID=522484 RepID=A0A222MZG0_9BACT|nr:tRNA lysidine(34) synthetase TilS [Campylobacter avium]ASQ31098.1 tRNA(Ile)-lysidine synthetase [Campylobacter avium LMG 24591]OYD78481.1 tRNA(Ile)-lysidine synthetase [Campylobacter avium]